MHYDAEALSRFLSGSEPDTKVAAHLMSCAKCRRMYESLMDAHELLWSAAILPGITLMPGEWIYCAALIGGDAFYGMPDVLGHMDDRGRAEAYIKARKNLEGRGLVEVAFDGTIGIKKRLFDIADICVNFERLLSMARRTPGRPERICNVFEKAGNSVVMHMDAAKGCTAALREGRVYFDDFPQSEDICGGKGYSRDEIIRFSEEIKGFGSFEVVPGFGNGDAPDIPIKQALSGSAEYYSVKELKKNPGGLASLRIVTVIGTYEGDYRLQYMLDKDEYFLFRRQDIPET